MKKRFRRTQIFLVITISFFILALPAYLRYTNLSEADFLSLDLSFESPDQDNVSSDCQNELKVPGPRAFSIIFFPEASLFEQSSHFFSQAPSLDQKTFVLLC